MGEELHTLEKYTSLAREDLLKAGRPGPVPADEIAALSLRGLLALAVGVAEQMIEQEREA